MSSINPTSTDCPISDANASDSNRRSFLRHALTVAVVAPLAACVRSAPAAATERTEGAVDGAQEAALQFEPLHKEKAEWKKLLEPDAYEVLFDEDTERPFSSPLNDIDQAGTFICRACYLPLFSASTKFKSGTGWPSFTKPIGGRIATKRDFVLLIPRTEYHCARCGGHQGHVFSDGPQPRGERWCNNGVALLFIPESETLPELRT